MLTGLDLQRYRPTVIVVEATLPTTRIESHTQWEGLLTRSDYAAVHFDGLSRFYLPGERMDLKMHFQLPPNIFDGFVTWQQTATEIELDRLRSETSRLRHDLDHACGTLVGFRGEAGRLNEVLAEWRPEIGDPDIPCEGTGGDSTTDRDSIDAIRRANWTLSSPSRLANYMLKAGMRSFRRRLAGGSR